jgi:hypothetical protein
MAIFSPSDSRPTTPARDALAAELDAMQAIARALEGIADHQTRIRVLAWANARFNAAAVPAAQPSPAPADAAARAAIGNPFDDPALADQTLDYSALAVEPLYDLFDDPQCPTPQTAAPPSHGESASVPAPAAGAAQAASEKQELDTLVKGFASDVQRLALDWQTA